MYGAARCDSLKVYFALNKATFNPELDNNAVSMKTFIDGLIVAAQSSRLDSIVVYGYASPEGPFLNNDRLSRQRCRTVADYISRHAGIPMDRIRMKPGCVAWDGLRELVIENSQTPSRAKVLKILDDCLPRACTDRALSERCGQSLNAIDGGYTYRWMLKNLFPKLRYSLAVYSYFAPEGPASGSESDGSESESREAVSGRQGPDLTGDSTDTDKTESGEGKAPEEGGPSTKGLTGNEVDSTVPGSAQEINDYTETVEPLHRLAIKTNLLYDAALLPNLEVEWRVNDKWSVALEGGVAWWGRYSRDRSYRLALVQPEVRRWLRTRAPWHGFYVGAFVGGGLYDFLKDRPGYRGEGAMAGLSAGYMWPVSRCLSLEAAIGAGYLFTRYKEYIPMDGHHVYQRTKDINYFGPLKVKFSLVWRLWDVNKEQRQKAKRINEEAI